MDDPHPPSDAEAPRDGQSQPRGLPAPVPAPSDASPQWTTIKYGTEHALQDMMIHVPPRRATDPPRTLWLVFLHGGGWRDPVQTRADILPAIALLSAPRHAAPCPASPASRASTTPSPPTPPAASLPPPAAATATRAHLRDAAAPRCANWRTCGVRARRADKVLAGHSCGATMAFQLAMGLDADLPRDAGVAAPLAVVGSEGLYDLGAAPYPEMFARAFGPDPGEWARVSPARYAGRLNAERGSGCGMLCWGILEVDLVDWQQSVGMCEAVRPGVGSVELVELVGQHDEVWSEGRELARLLAHAVDTVVTDQRLNS